MVILTAGRGEHGIGGYTARQILDKIGPYLKEGAEITIVTCKCLGQEWQTVADSYSMGWRVSSLSTPDTNYYAPTGNMKLFKGYKQWLDRNKHW